MSSDRRVVVCAVKKLDEARFVAGDFHRVGHTIMEITRQYLSTDAMNMDMCCSVHFALLSGCYDGVFCGGERHRRGPYVDPTSLSTYIASPMLRPY